MDLVKIIPHSPSVVLSGVLKGVYAAGTDYAPGEVVTYQGGTYIMHTDAAAGTAPTDTTKWQAINSPQAYVESIGELSLVNTTTDNTISVDQNGNVGTAVATDGAIHIENTGNTGIGLGVYTNIGATADAPLVSIKADNSAFDQSVVILQNDGGGKALEIINTNTGGTGLHITQNGGNGVGINATSGDNVYGVGMITVSLKNGSDSGDCLRLSHVGDGAHINFAGDTTNTSSVDGDLWFDGTNLKLNVGGTVYNIDKTSV